jgi:CubicO group peptidase (beta-lactamase class C family)
MKKFKHLAICVFFVSLVFGGVGRAQENVRINNIGLDTIQKQISNKILEILEESGIPSLSISLIRNDKVIWAEAFGYSNVKMKLPATSETIYCTGSTFKFLTATAIMQLQEQGKLDIDDPINNYLGEESIDDYSDIGKPVTFRHLLSHHSGLSGPLETIPLWSRDLPRSLKEVVSKISATSDPGTEYNYCNHCYALAGYLVEKISGKKFQVYIVENILKPLGITNLGPVVPTPTMLELMALPYMLREKIPVPIYRVRFDVFPAGDTYLTAKDMAKFLTAQLNFGKYNGNSILSPESVKEMQKPQFGSSYGLGTGVTIINGNKILTHSGGVAGFNSLFVIDCENKTGIYIVGNTIFNPKYSRDIANLAIGLLNGGK